VVDASPRINSRMTPNPWPQRPCRRSRTSHILPVGEVVGRLYQAVTRQRRLNPRDHQLRGLDARGLRRRRQRE
jgi:hypothetical protein